MEQKSDVQVCEEFLRDPTRNPRTGRKIKATGKVYKDLVVLCNSLLQESVQPTIPAPSTSPVIAPSLPTTSMRPVIAPSLPTTLRRPVTAPSFPTTLTRHVAAPSLPTSRSTLPKILTRDQMIITEDSPRLSYRRRSGEDKKAVHWGQRKLLLSEIEFLTNYLDSLNTPAVVVYAGAAPGTHIAFLKQLFPALEFHLYDPRRFDTMLSKIPGIYTYQQLFLDDDAEKWRDKATFFISDIRTADYTVMEELENEEAVMSDMIMQANWVEIIRPQESLLKFRLPYADRWPEPTFSYLDGTIHKQIWPPQSSSETRLVPSHPLTFVSRDIKKYEDQLFYHNAIVREEMEFANPFTGRPTAGLDPPELVNNYDSMAEVNVLSDYLSKFNSFVTKSDVVALSREITAHLNKGRRRWKTLNQ